MSVFTARQAEEVAVFKRGELARLNIYDGSVRSGKTWITAVIWALWLSSQERGGNFLMCGKTITSLKRNVLDLLVDQFGAKNISYNTSAKTARIFGKPVLLEGASDARSEAKIRGLTLLGAYCDELTLFPEDFFAMLLSRLSMSGAKLFATTNPDSPLHWLWKGYLSPETIKIKGLSLYHARFLIDDNTTLEPEYLENIKREYTGVFYDRYILGKWSVAEGLIYPEFNRAVHVVEAPPGACMKHYISMDYGIQNATSMALWGLCGGVWYRLREYYHSGRDSREQKTDEEYYDELVKLAGDVKITAVIIDPSAASFIALVGKRRAFRVIHADNAVVEGIRKCASALQLGYVKICACCKAFLLEVGAYAWDAKAQEEKPIKVADHAMDDFRYFVATIVAEKGVIRARNRANYKGLI